MNHIEKSGGRERPSQGGGTADQGGGTADRLGDPGGMSARRCPSNNWLGVHGRGQGWSRAFWNHFPGSVTWSRGSRRVLRKM